LSGNEIAASGEGRAEVAAYCREIETYLCRKNDGHLIRVAGPSFEIVSGWASRGVPLKVAFRGIDRYFERYYRAGRRRRPVRIDFCEADVLDTFEEWRRALGLPMPPERDRTSGAPFDTPSGVKAAGNGPSGEAEEVSGPGSGRRGPSLPEHLERCVLKLTSARASGVLGGEADALLDQVVAELDTARSRAHGVRGEARRALIERLARLDAELLLIVAAARGEAERRSVEKEAERDLAPYGATMSEEAFRRARALAIERALRERSGLPTLTYS
jgi:hypothetical protein